MVMVFTLAGAALALTATALPVPPYVLVAAAVVYGFGIGACQPITMSWLSSLALPGQRGGVLSLRLVGNRFAQSTIPAVAGLVAAPLGGAGVIAAVAVSLAVATWAGAAVPDTESG
jgi:MFS family permease